MFTECSEGRIPRQNIARLLEMLLEHLIFRRPAKMLAARFKLFAQAAPKSPPTEPLFRNARGSLEKLPRRKRYFTAPETYFVLHRLIRRSTKCIENTLKIDKTTSSTYRRRWSQSRHHRRWSQSRHHPTSHHLRAHVVLGLLISRSAISRRWCRSLLLCHFG
jgi:hypothetical protein